MAEMELKKQQEEQILLRQAEESEEKKLSSSGDFGNFGEVQRNQLKESVSRMFVSVTDQKFENLNSEDENLGATEINRIKESGEFNNFGATGELRKDKLKTGTPLTRKERNHYIRDYKTFKA